MRPHSARLAAAVASVLVLGSCGRHAPQSTAPAGNKESSTAFVARINHEMLELSRETNAAGFAYATYINPDTEFLNAKANERYLKYFSDAVAAAKAYEKEQLDPASARAIELGHVFYYLSYKDQPFLFQGGANDGFHEAIGDTINLSMTPEYLHQIGLLGAVKRSDQATINQQMRLALDKIAFLPFGKLIDEWRWQVFAGEIKPENYNAAWWQLREQYQGVAPPVARSEEDFDPGAKYHIPANTPYTRYFLSYILQFQFHKALCEAAGHKGPLHECSVYGNEAAGKRFREMLALGQSQPWQETLAKLTGRRDIDAGAIMEYFAPLRTWLDEQNKGQTCGW